MNIILIFGALTLLMDLPDIRKTQQRKLPWYIAVFSALLIWNCLAVQLPGWPTPNDVILILFGWVDPLLKGG